MFMSIAFSAITANSKASFDAAGRPFLIGFIGQ